MVNRGGRDLKDANDTFVHLINFRERSLELFIESVGKWRNDVNILWVSCILFLVNNL